MFVEVLKYEPGGVPSFAGAGSANQATSQAADSLANQLKGTTTKQSMFYQCPTLLQQSIELDGASLDYLLLLVLVKSSRFSSRCCDWKISQPGAVAQNFADEELRGITGGGMGIDLMRNYFKSKAQLSIVNALAGTNIGLNDVLGRQSGQIVNQNVELLFNGVSIRPFGFNFDFTPRNEKRI